VYFSCTKIYNVRNYLSTSFLWLLSRYLTTATEMESLCHEQFLCYFEIYYFSVTKLYAVFYQCMKKMSEFAYAKEKSATEKTFLKFHQKFLV
jgi:hypothetical protein